MSVVRLANRLGRQVVVACHLGSEIAAEIATHWSKPKVIDLSTAQEYWSVPEGADVLFTTPGDGWKRAPDSQPGVWPVLLSWVQTSSAGVDAYPRWLGQGVILTCGRGIASVSIAEYVLAAALAFDKRIHELAVTSAEEWQPQLARDMERRVLGLAGYGAIGRAVAARAHAFGMKVLAFRKSPWNGIESIVKPVRTLEALFQRSDHVVLTLPLTHETIGIVNRKLLRSAKPKLHIINVARGALIDQGELADAISSGHIGGATLDVTTPEPLPTGHVLYDLPEVRITPHISWNSENYQQRLVKKFCDNLDRFLAGQPLEDVVTPERGY